VRRLRAPNAPLELDLPVADVRRRRPRCYAEWEALRRWNKLPEWEDAPIGFLLRAAREQAGWTQAQLGRRLRTSQQAVAQAERPDSNPTVGFVRRWLESLPGGQRLKISVEL